LFSVETTTIKNWKRLRAQTGKLEGTGRPCNPYKIDADALKLYIKERPDAFLNEIASHFTDITFWRHNPGNSYSNETYEYHSKKKISLYKERCATKRSQYIEVIEQLSPERLVYVDESGIDSFVSRDDAWSERGQPVIGETAGKRFARESFAAGLMNKNIVASMCYQ
jgi:hypothetical protein